MSNEHSNLRVTMVKKRLANGEPCRKCAQAEDMLTRRELWDMVDEVVVADESDANSAGMLLAKEHQVEVAPFFLVSEGGETRVFDSVIKLAKEVLAPRKASSASSVDATTGVHVAPLQAQVQEKAVQFKGAAATKILEFALDALGDRC